MLKLLRYFRLQDWIGMLILLVIVYYQVSFDLILADYMDTIVGAILMKAETNEILRIGGEMLLASLGSVITKVIVSLIAVRISASFSSRLRTAVYDKVSSLSSEEMGQFSTASLMTRTTNDVQQVQLVVMILLNMASTAPIMAVRALMKVYDMSQEITLIVAIAVFLIVALITTIFAFALPRFKRIQTNVDQLNLVTRENLTGLRVIKAFNAEAYQEAKFEKTNTELANNHIFVNRLMSLIDPAMGMILSGVNLTIIWLGAYLISWNQLGSNPLGKISSFTLYTTQIMFSFMMLTMVFIMVPRSEVSAKRISEVLRTKNKILDPITPTPIATVKGSIEFRNVSFQYHEATAAVIDNISFTVNPGETVAFIGSTGSGKSTLINLIPRFYDVTSGEVLVDGINVKDYKLKDLYQKIGYVPQKGLLFKGTIASNLALGDETYSLEEMDDAISISQAEEFVAKLDEKLDYPIAQGGKNVSGGQKQRLCIARAIIKKPEIYIFDDSFSALDYQTDRRLRQALRESTNATTSLIVAQRIGTILHADKIIVLEKGRMVGMGTHRKLMESCQVYKEMAYSQLSKEELDNGQ